MEAKGRSVKTGAQRKKKGFLDSKKEKQMATQQRQRTEGRQGSKGWVTQKEDATILKLRKKKRNNFPPKTKPNTVEPRVGTHVTTPIKGPTTFREHLPRGAGEKEEVRNTTQKTHTPHKRVGNRRQTNE